MKTTVLNPQLEESINNKQFKDIDLSKKRKGYTEKLLHFLIRETDSDKRMSVFGMDPFK
jgi:hypothetical protein